MSSIRESKSNIAYQSVSIDGNGSTEADSTHQQMELGNHPPLEKAHGWLSTIILQLFGLAWLVPVVTLLYLNFAEYVIGASAWCIGGHCWLDGFNPVTSVPQARMHRYDKDDHNLLGALQFVAKALEVWFGIVATALVYLVTMRFAGKKEGLPIGYLTRPSEFADILSLFDKLFWTTGPTPLGVKSQGDKRVGRRVWALIALCVFLCALSNLMGPATAVLVIPGLQWLTTENYGTHTYLGSNAGDPPTSNWRNWMWWNSPYCTIGEFAAHNYTCNLDPFGYSLDQWLNSYLSSGWATTGHTTQNGIANSLTFMANATSQSSSPNALTGGQTDYVYWAPSRQTISNLSVDQDAVGLLSLGFSENRTQNLLARLNYYPDPSETYAEYNKSLELVIVRNGPVLGAAPVMWFGYDEQSQWNLVIDANRHIRCYADYTLYNTPLSEGTSHGNYTKCVRLGSGWSATNKKASFSVPTTLDSLAKQNNYEINVEVTSSDKAVYLPHGKLPSWLPPACLSEGKLLNNTICNWDRLFTTNASDPMANRTRNVNTISYTMNNVSDSVEFVVDFVGYHAFTDYTFDPEPFSNPLSLVQTEQLPTTGTSFPLDPTWILAAFSVADGGSLLPNRTSTNLLLGSLDTMLKTTIYDISMDYIAFLPIMHTLSIIDHSTAVLSNPPDSADQPRLVRNARMYVWAYGLTSRTAMLGAIVAIAGCVVVVTQFVLGFTDRREMRSPTQLLVAALEHCPKGEFADMKHDETAMARVRFHIKDNEEQTGKYSFYEPELKG